VRTVFTYNPNLIGSGTLGTFMDLVAFVNSSNMTVVLVNPTTNAIGMNVTGLTGNSANVYQIATAAPYNTDMTLIGSSVISGGTITNVNLAANSVTVIVTCQVQSAGFGVQSNEFGFTITGASNLAVVVEASSNLVNSAWVPLSTNTLTGGSSYFSDPQWTNFPGRFYRLNSP